MGILDSVLNFATDRRDRDHSEHREDRLRYQDRQYFESDRADQRKYDSRALQRLRADANAAGIHPLAALGAQTVGPSTSFQSQGYGGGGSGRVPINVDDSGASEVNAAQARLLNKQADLIDNQIEASSLARLRPKNEDLAEPYEITPQTFTPVLDHAIFGEPIKSDPTVANAEAHTTRSGESELYEMILGAVINAKDWLYTRSGLTWRKRMGAKRFDQHMRRDNTKKYLERTGKQYYRFD